MTTERLGLARSMMVPSVQYAWHKGHFCYRFTFAPIGDVSEVVVRCNVDGRWQRWMEDRGSWVWLPEGMVAYMFCRHYW